MILVVRKQLEKRDRSADLPRRRGAIRYTSCTAQCIPSYNFSFNFTSLTQNGDTFRKKKVSVPFYNPLLSCSLLKTRVK